MIYKSMYKIYYSTNLSCSKKYLYMKLKKKSKRIIYSNFLKQSCQIQSIIIKIESNCSIISTNNLF